MAAQPEFVIQKIYLKDLSFESPNTPELFLEEWNPNVDLDFNVDHKKMDDDNHNIDLQVTVTAKMGDKTVFVAEVKQSGIFMIKNIPEEELEGVLKGVCPNIIFPYARQKISDLTGDGGFPPLYLSPINFEAIYAQEKMGAAANGN